MSGETSVGGWVGVLLAAGRGRRMGGGKQLVIWPRAGKPLVAAAFDTIEPACVRMVVVLGHEAAAVESALRPRVFATVLAEPDAAMFESARAGLAAVRAGGGCAGAILLPADHPGVGAGTLTRLLEAARAHPGWVVMPEYAGRGGHPVLIPVSWFAEVLAYHGAGGLRECWRTHPDRCLRLPVDDPWVVRDMDTPADIALPPGDHRGDQSES